MRKLTIYLLFGFSFLGAFAQAPLSIDSCHWLAKNNYPLIKQFELLTQSESYTLSNASKAYFPQVALVGQATYQNDVVNIPTGVPGQTRPVLQKDQYRFFADVNQNLYDGGTTRYQKALGSAITKVDMAKAEVDLFTISERVNQLFFSLMLLQEQIKLQELVISDLSAMLRKMEAMVEEGALLKSNKDALKADYLKSQQRLTELKWGANAFANMLGLFIGRSVEANLPLQKPEPPKKTVEVSRPELSLFANQQQLLLAQQHLVQSKVRPRLSLFGQGGYAYPGFDFFKDEFAWFYIGGIRLNWQLSNLYTQQNERKLLGVQAKLVTIQEEVFRFNLDMAYKQQVSEEQKYLELLKTDEELITLRMEIKDRAAVQLTQGVILATDYLRELNAGDMAMQNKLIHELQWLQVQYNQKQNRGN